MVIWVRYVLDIDDAQKINKLNAPSFNGLVVAWKVWKEKWHKIKGDRGEPAKNCDAPIWLIVWCVWVCDKFHIGYLLGWIGLY